jgi:hypothetical protein
MGKRKAETTTTAFDASVLFQGFSWHSGDPKLLAEGRLAP